MKWLISDETITSNFVRAIEEESGQNITGCYQCGKCTAGCPIAAEMEYTPHQIIRFVQLGLEDVALSSSTIWMCATCQTCTTRCPREVDIAKIMDALRIVSFREDKKRGLFGEGFWKKFLKRAWKSVLNTFEMDMPSNSQAFTKIFLECIKKYGRLAEPGLFINYNINSGFFFSSIKSAPGLILKNKLKFFPHKVATIDKVQIMFDRIEEMEKEEQEKAKNN